MALSESRALAVCLSGPPDAHFAFALGMYQRLDEMCQQRHVYASSDGQFAMWWAHGAWYVGSRASTGKRGGFLAAKENTDVPEDISVPWMASSPGSGWVETPGVSCVTEEARAEAARAAVSDAADTVYIVGSCPGAVNAACIGAYVRQADQPLCNERFTYLNATAACGPLMLWASHAVTGSWYVGAPADVGTRRGLLSVEDATVRPEAIAATWQVATADGFVAAPALSCGLVPPTRGELIMDAATATTLFAVQSVVRALAVVEVAQHGEDAPTSLRKAFDTFDIDQSGTLDAEELLQILTRQTQHGAALSADDAKALIAMFDTNGDGVLDFDEFLGVMSASAPPPSRLVEPSVEHV